MTMGYAGLQGFCYRDTRGARCCTKWSLLSCCEWICAISSHSDEDPLPSALPSPPLRLHHPPIEQTTSLPPPSFSKPKVEHHPHPPTVPNRPSTPTLLHGRPSTPNTVLLPTRTHFSFPTRFSYAQQSRRRATHRVRASAGYARVPKAARTAAGPCGRDGKKKQKCRLGCEGGGGCVGLGCKRVAMGVVGVGGSDRWVMGGLWMVGSFGQRWV